STKQKKYNLKDEVRYGIDQIITPQVINNIFKLIEHLFLKMNCAFNSQQLEIYVKIFYLSDVHYSHRVYSYERLKRRVF
ncbi:MAG: hypothetical protein Q8874_02475, partial [Sweet potato little leaf phytoplasma]|nr:hypothetical protein [Sweet potato little leaf phytoplasma]